MHWLVPAIVATLANSVVLASIYLFLYVRERDADLRIFFVSWSVYAVRFVFMLLFERHGLVWLLAANQVCVLVSSHLLFVGIRRWMGRTAAPAPWIIATGLVVAWVAGAGFADVGFTVFTVPAMFYGGLLYIRSGTILLRADRHGSVGRIVVAVTLILWGVHKFNYPFLRPVEWFAPWGYLLGGMAATITGIGVMLGYFERARDQLAASNHQNEILIREVQHRVKNNLAVIHSLVRQQAATARAAETRAALATLESRIFAFALTYQFMHRFATLDGVDLVEYLRTLATHLEDSHGERRGTIEVGGSVASLALDIGQVNNVGLIVNELVTNSFKHAFPDGRERRVSLTIDRPAADEVVLEIADAGIGFDEDRLGDAPHSGLFLVRLLVEDRGGSLRFVVDNGTRAVCRIPIEVTGASAAATAGR